jgi:hypothetical protein
MWNSLKYRQYLMSLVAAESQAGILPEQLSRTGVRWLLILGFDWLPYWRGVLVMGYGVGTAHTKEA